ncbi:MAG: hypothetical protein ACRCUT_03790, partial [Spirochaetota bacterium]
MYYRYKSKKRAKKSYELILIAVLIVAALTGLFHFRNYLLFWKFTYNRLAKQIHSAEAVADPVKRSESLEKAVAACDGYRNDNPFQSDGYFLSAKSSYLIGETEAGGSLSLLVIEDAVSAISVQARGQFENAVRYIKKGMSLDSNSRPDDEILVILAKSYFYLDYYKTEEIQSVLSQIRDPGGLPGLDDRRFFGLMLIQGGDPEGGVKFL